MWVCWPGAWRVRWIQVVVMYCTLGTILYLLLMVFIDSSVVSCIAVMFPETPVTLPCTLTTSCPNSHNTNPNCIKQLLYILINHTIVKIINIYRILLEIIISQFKDQILRGEPYKLNLSSLDQLISSWSSPVSTHSNWFT